MWECFGISYEDLKNACKKSKHVLMRNIQKTAVDIAVKKCKAGLKGSIMVSDGLFPFKDGVEVGPAIENS